MKTLAFRILFLFLPQILFITKLNAEESKSDIKYIISLNKKQFIEGEEIILSMKFVNIGKQIDSIVNFSEPVAIQGLLIKDSENQKSRYTGPIGSPSKTFVLKPGEEYLFTSNLEFDRGTISEGVFVYFPKAVYTIKGQYQDKKYLIESNELIFEVVVPEEPEISVFNAYRRLQSIAPSELSHDSLRWLIAQFEDLIKRNPSSMYLDKMFENVVIKKLVSDSFYDSTIIDDCMWLLENRPDSKIIDFAINQAVEIIYYREGGKGKANIFFNNLKNKYPNSRISGISEKLREDPKYK